LPPSVWNRLLHTGEAGAYEVAWIVYQRDRDVTNRDYPFNGALTVANNTTSTGTINFNIPGSGVKTIGPDSPLPIITSPVTIDGYTQGDGTVDDATPNTLALGNNANLLIELNGVNATVPETEENPTPALPIGLWLGVGSAGSTVRGLVINRFEREGIRITTANNVVEGNFIGTDASGTLPRGNFLDGVLINQAGNRVGGTTPGARNVISDNNNGSGVSITGVDNAVEGNYKGTDASGTASLGNSFDGVAVGGINNAIFSNSIFSNNQLGIDLRGGQRTPTASPPTMLATGTSAPTTSRTSPS
jgi:hypothetical protein